MYEATVSSIVGELDLDGELDPPDDGSEEVLGSIEGSDDDTDDGCVDGLAEVSVDGSFDGVDDGDALGACDTVGVIVPTIDGGLDSDGAFDPSNVGSEEVLGSSEGSGDGDFDGIFDGYEEEIMVVLIEGVNDGSSLGRSDVDGINVSTEVGDFDFEGEFDG